MITNTNALNFPLFNIFPSKLLKLFVPCSGLKYTQLLLFDLVYEYSYVIDNAVSIAHVTISSCCSYETENRRHRG
jgi:hypothetical protein